MMPPSKRHFSRNNIHPSRISSTSINTTVIDDTQKLRKVCPTCISKGLCDILPVHIPVPIASSENHLITEFIVAIFSLICCFIQYLNIYQGAWWLSNSQPYYGMNIHLIDWFVVHFIVIMCFRPYIFSLFRKYSMMIINQYEEWETLNACLLSIVIRYSLVLLLFCYSAYCLYYFWKYYGFMLLLVMFFPWMLYAYIYVKNIQEFLNYNIVPFPSAGFIKGILVHRCDNSSQKSRDEVDFLRTDFNARMKCLLFNSFCNAYYCVYMPACFSQGPLYFEENWVAYYIFLVWFTCICIYITRYFSFNYYDTCHRAALHLGNWSKVNGRFAPCYTWVDSMYWYKGITVKHNGLMYKAECLTNSAEPGNKIHEYFYFCFAKPGSLIYWWLGIQTSVIGLQFLFLLISSEWNHVLASSVLLLSMHHSLYKCIQNYNLCITLYKLEELIQARLIAS